MSDDFNPSSLDRKQVEFLDGERRRVYYTESVSPMPSVTTVLSEKHNPDKESGLEGWRDWFDGSEPKRSPHWRDQKHYKQFRGTLVHWDVGNVLGDVPETDEEQAAREKLQNWFAWKPTAYEYGTVSEGKLPASAFEQPAIDEDLYGEIKTYRDAIRAGLSHARALSVSDASLRARQRLADLDSTYDGVDAWKRVQAEREWARDRAATVLDDLPITEVVDTETYVADRGWGYAGQFDILGRDDEDRLWIGDLKTSSSIDRIGYKLQLAAYAHAYDGEIDGAFLLRMHPDDEVVEVHTHHDWDRSLQGLTNEFLALTERTHVKKLPDFE